MLLDFADDPPLTISHIAATTDFRGFPNAKPEPYKVINGRISSINSQQQLAWSMQNINADGELFATDGTLENGDTMTDDQGILWRVVGRARRVRKGSLPDFYKYPISSHSFT